MRFEDLKPSPGRVALENVFRVTKIRSLTVQNQICILRVRVFDIDVNCSALRNGLDEKSKKRALRKGREKSVNNGDSALNERNIQMSALRAARFMQKSMVRV